MAHLLTILLFCCTLFSGCESICTLATEQVETIQRSAYTARQLIFSDHDYANFCSQWKPKLLQELTNTQSLLHKLIQEEALKSESAELAADLNTQLKYVQADLESGCKALNVKDILNTIAFLENASLRLSGLVVYHYEKLIRQSECFN